MQPQEETRIGRTKWGLVNAAFATACLSFGLSVSIADASQYFEVASAPSPANATALIYAPGYDALVLKNAGSAVVTLNLVTQYTTTHFAFTGFNDIAISPSGRYVFAADYGGENIGYG